MTESNIKTLIQQELPQLIAQDPWVRDFILRTVSDYYANKQETESKFDRILNELQRDRQEQAHKWDEQNRKWEEQNRKWDENTQRFDNILADLQRDRQEQARKWDENAQQNNEILAELRKADKRYESTIGALGSRWGLSSEASFRNGLAGILGESFGVTVMNITEYDDTGEVFGRPDQVEIDIIIKNGHVIACELKSSMSKADLYIFDRKAKFYAKKHQCQVNRKIVICPMVADNAFPIAKVLGIEIYSYADRFDIF